ncbi:MAG: hypothetical protein ACJ8AO_06340 [Gemmatimonadaceae bacterium]
MPPLRTRAFIAATLLAAACAPHPVAWSEQTSFAGGLPDEAVLAFGADDSVRVERAAPAGGVSPAPAGCPGSVRRARAAGGATYAAWWRARADSSAELLVARSDDGGATWSAASVAESRDRSPLGCARPEPGVAVDSASGTVHVAYWATLADGPGVFFTHATSARGVGAPVLPPEHLAHMGAPAGDSAGAHGGHAAPDVLWHAPVAVVHGERPSRAAVAVRGDTVAVAFEDPNSGPRPRIALALSRQMGHLFDARDHEVSGGDVAAERPLVALRGGAVAVAWREEGRPDALAVRVGRIDWRSAAGSE